VWPACWRLSVNTVTSTGTMPLMAETKTRAIETAVAVLLATSGVTAAIGVFEAQDHHSAIGWFTSCAATLIAAILLPFAAFILFPWIENLGGLPIEKVSQRSSKRDIPQPGQYQQNGRVIISSTPEILIQERQKYETGVQASAAMQRYVGKWIEARGWIHDMYFIGKTKDMLVLIVDSKNDPPKSLLWRDFSIALHFNNKQTIDQISTLNQGDPITALGKIDEITEVDITLQNCELPDTFVRAEQSESRDNSLNLLPESDA
jgi:hypothetical protein